MKPLVCLEAVEKRHGGRVVFSGLDWRVWPRERWGVLGPSGAGKSTLLRLIAGLEPPSGGRVVNHAESMGFVFQEPRLLPWRTALENVAMVLRAKGMSRTAARELARQKLVEVELTGCAGAYPAQLSGGMRQRVALARSLAVEPDLLLLDEPFTGLDRQLRQTMRALLDSILQKSRTAVVHVTHDRRELAGGTSRILELPTPDPYDFADPGPAGRPLATRCGGACRAR